MKSNSITRISTLAAAIGLVLSSGAIADSGTAGQDVGYVVDEIALISVTGSPTLAITTTTDGLAGSAPADATDATTAKWAITVNKAAGKKVTAELTASMPAHTLLSVELAAPSTGASKGVVPLNTRATGVKVAAVDVVDSIEPDYESNLGVTYTLSADVEAGVLTATTATVTYTVASL
jgi:hypothetical protein